MNKMNWMNEWMNELKWINLAIQLIEMSVFFNLLIVPVCCSSLNLELSIGFFLQRNLLLFSLHSQGTQWPSLDIFKHFPSSPSLERRLEKSQGVPSSQIQCGDRNPLIQPPSSSRLLASSFSCSLWIDASSETSVLHSARHENSTFWFRRHRSQLLSVPQKRVISRPHSHSTARAWWNWLLFWQRCWIQ